MIIITSHVYPNPNHIYVILYKTSQMWEKSHPIIPEHSDFFLFVSIKARLYLKLILAQNEMMAKR